MACGGQAWSCAVTTTARDQSAQVGHPPTACQPRTALWWQTPHPQRPHAVIHPAEMCVGWLLAHLASLRSLITVKIGHPAKPPPQRSLMTAARTEHTAADKQGAGEGEAPVWIWMLLH
jgi:hypothetical protein